MSELKTDNPDQPESRASRIAELVTAAVANVAVAAASVALVAIHRSTPAAPEAKQGTVAAAKANFLRSVEGAIVIATASKVADAFSAQAAKHS